MKTKLIAPVLACALALALCGPAQAHVYIAKRSPGKNATLSKSPAKVRVAFTGQLIKGSLSVRRASSGKLVASGGMIDARTVQARVGGRLGRGSYRVRVAVTGGDGHRQSFHWTFEVA
jgi:methionine-rich copper-binding protein CopC